MNKELKNIVKKTAKIGGVICVAAGAVAIVTSKTALQVILKGGEYFKDAVKKIVNEEPDVEETSEEPIEMAHDEVTAEAQDFEEDDSQEEPASEENV